MNLIEQLGGYERARVLLQGAGHEYDAVLLQHRRESGIYDAGDKVIHGRYCREIFDVVSIRGDSCSISSSEISILKIGVDLEDIRHAIDAEIEAKMRLEMS